MIGVEKFFFALGVLCAVSALPGCSTAETATTTTTHASSAVTASTESVAVSVSAETTTTTRSMTTTPPPSPPPPSPAADVLAGAKKPCGTVAADAPKFVKPETEK